MTDAPIAGNANSVGALRRNLLKARRLGIDMQQEAVVFMRSDCHVCRAEGFTAHARVQLGHDDRTVVATLYHAVSDILGPGEAGLSESAWRQLAVKEGDAITVHHPPPLDSLSVVRGKVYGRRP
jgi:thymidine phosphorylase